MKAPKHAKAAARKKAPGSSLESLFVTIMKVHKLHGGMKSQYKAVIGRGFVWDFAWPDVRLLVEIHGGEWSGGAHVTGKGVTRDCEKLNAAALAGWACLAYTGSMVQRNSREMAQEIKTFLDTARQTRPMGVLSHIEDAGDE